MMRSGHPQNQAIAAALNVARNTKAMGGGGSTRIKLGNKKTAPNIKGFMDEFYKNTNDHPFDSRTRILGNTTVDLQPHSEGVHLSDIRSLAPRSGAGTDALKYLTTLADKHNVPLDGTAKAYHPDKKYIGSNKKLASWYADNGFKVDHDYDDDGEGYEVNYDPNPREGRAMGGGLYANIHAKRERIAHGSKEKMRKPNSKGAPTAAAFKQSARTAKAGGGNFGFPKPRQVDYPETVPTFGTSPMNKVHEGPIHSPVAGRTDHLPMNVDSGSYVIPADIISAMGEGNTMAGFKVARKMFSSQPYMQNDKQPYSPSPSPYAEGKPYGARASGGASPVEIVAAGGEYVIKPDDVVKIGNGDMDHGHEVLDHFVKQYRKRTIETLKKLPGPKRD